MNPQQLNFFTELLKRLATSKPAFFKKLQGIVLVIAVLFLLLILGNNYFEIYDLGIRGDKAQKVLWFIVGILGGSLGTAQFTTTSPELQDDKTKENVVKSLDQSEIYEIKNK